MNTPLFFFHLYLTPTHAKKQPTVDISYLQLTVVISKQLLLTVDCLNQISQRRSYPFARQTHESINHKQGVTKT